MKGSNVQKDSNRLEELEEALGYSFRDRALLQLALTHTSYANEHRKEGVHDNERLEFLGDAVLETISSEYLYRKFPEEPEGSMSKMRASMVCEPTLALCARRIGLENHLRLGRGEIKTGGGHRDSIISDALESVIGAIFLDSGYASAEAFVQRHILGEVDRSELFVDSKTLLQEMVQGFGGELEYVLTGEEGPDHAKRFTVDAVIGGRAEGSGEGPTKKAAEQQAARMAIKKIKGTADGNVS